MRRIAILGAALGLALGACSSGADGKNGNNGRSELVKVAPEPAGANCAAGGFAIEQGLDANGNGVLDSNEINAAETVYVCNGVAASGMSGTNGEYVLVSVSTEPAGANCQYGGERIDSGFDSNGDGTLEAGEISSTRYVCDGNLLPGYHFGDVYVDLPGDVVQLDGVTTLVGNLYVSGSVPPGTALAFDTLAEVSGEIVINSSSGCCDRSARGTGGCCGRGVPARNTGDSNPSGLTSVSFPSLLTAAEIIADDSDSLADLELPALTRVDYLEVENNGLLETLNLAGLQSAPVGIYVSSDGLRALSLPALTSVGNLQVRNVNAMTSFSAPALVKAGTLQTVNMDELTSIHLDALAQADTLGLGGPLVTTLVMPALTQAGTLGISSGALTSISLSALASVQLLDIESNALLTSLSLPALRNAYRLVVANNPELDTCVVYAINAALTAPLVNDQIDASGDLPSDDDCVSPPATETIALDGIADTLVIDGDYLDFDDAEAACEQLGTGAHLFWFENAGEIATLIAAMQNSWLPSDNGLWYGYTDATDANVGTTTTEGTWVPLSGDAAFNPVVPGATQYGFWVGGEPNGGTTENCLQQEGNGRFNDLTCSSALPSLCRIPAAPSRR